LEALPRGELTRRAEEIASRHYDIPDSKRHAVSVDTLLEWARRYRNGGSESLVPKPRKDCGQYRVITAQIADQIERLKQEDPHWTGATLLRELALSSGKAPVSAAILYRYLRQRGLTTQKLPPGIPLQPLRNKWHTNFICDEDREVLTQWPRSNDKSLWQKVTVLEHRNLPAKCKEIALFRYACSA
jgi:transposase